MPAAAGAAVRERTTPFGQGVGRPAPTDGLTAARALYEELSKGMGNAMITVLKKDKGIEL